VKLVDANVLLYAVNSDARHHDQSRRRLDGALSGDDTVLFA
jgi:predicted nucleic acid-binding protein